MSQLCQLVYASRATLETPNREVGVTPEMARILTQSRRNNKSIDVGGVLCFGDGHFFQCLEGERDVVERLYERIENDSRHRDVVLLRNESVHHRQYGFWAMKYCSVDRPIRTFLSQRGMDRFDPFKLDESGIDQLLSILREDAEAETTRSAGNRSTQVNPMAASGGVSPALLGVGALCAAITVVAMIVLVIL